MKKNDLFTLFIIFYLLSVGYVPSASGSTLSIQTGSGTKLKVEPVFQGLDIPWAMAFLNPSEMIITQRTGKIGILVPETGRFTVIKDVVPGIKHGGQGGLLDVAVPLDYTAGDWIYFTYSKAVNGEGATALARARRNKNRLDNWEDLLVTRSAAGGSRHFGSRMTFDTQGHLYFTVGDRGDRPTAQDLSNHAGSILRLRIDGSIPDDNPFLTVKEALPEIYSYGHRNPQGIVFDPLNNRLWTIEHGPRGGDEINLVLPGRNYGWPKISYGKEYWGPFHVGDGTHKKGMEQPVKYYVPSIAPGSLILYSGRAFPEWKGNLMAGALKMEHINRLAVSASGAIVSEERLLEELQARIRALAEGPEGWIYFSTDNGKIYRIRPATVKKREP